VESTANKKHEKCESENFDSVELINTFCIFSPNRRRATFNVGMEIEKRLANYAKQAIVGNYQRDCNRM
jgi:hypothetical protein